MIDKEETPLVKTKHKPFRPEELANQEIATLRIMPEKLVYLRNNCVTSLHRTLFSVWRVPVSLGALLFIAFVLITIAVIEISSYYSGKLYRYSGIITSVVVLLLFLFASRNSLFIFLTGVSYERAMRFHKFFAIIALLLALIHGYTNLDYISEKKSGVIMVCTLTLMILFAYYAIRRWQYTWWAKLHIISSFVLPYYAYKHGAYLVIVGFVIWIIDVIIRLVLYVYNSKKTVKVQVDQLNDITRLRIQNKGISYKAGQYLYLVIPKITTQMMHPFTISSSPHEKDITLHIKPIGSYTKKLYKLAGEHNELTVIFEGPYGNPSINFYNPKYTVFVFIVGGIGVTPAKCMINTITDHFNRGRKVDKIMLLWNTKSAKLADDVFEKKTDIVLEESTKHNKNGIADLKLFLTGSEVGMREVGEMKDFFESKVGRCNVAEELIKIEGYCIKKNISNVAVLSCGPESLNIDVEKQVQRLNKGKVSFGLHVEVFEF